MNSIRRKRSVLSPAEDVEKNLYGEERLLEFFQNVAKSDSSQTVIEDLFSSVKKFTGGNAQNDDITALTVKL